MLDSAETTVLCSHGPVVGQIIAAVAAAAGNGDAGSLSRAASLSPGEYAGLHIPADRPETGIVAVEVHSPTA